MIMDGAGIDISFLASRGFDGGGEQATKNDAAYRLYGSLQTAADFYQE